MKISDLDLLDTGFTPPADFIPIVHAGKTWRVAASDVAAASSGGPYLALSGGVLSGPLTLMPGDPLQPQHAASKHYVDIQVGTGGGGDQIVDGGSF